MTDEEIREYLNGKPTIPGIVAEMKTWWTNEGSDTVLQECFDKIIELDAEKTRKWIDLKNGAYQCPFCKNQITGIPSDLNYCHYCGARLVHDE